MIKVPVTLGFDENKLVGMCELDESRLPPKPDWHLALGYFKAIATDNYNLMTLSVTNDTNFKPLDDPAPIPMVLHCPQCHVQHIDGADKPKRTCACHHTDDTRCYACETINKGLWTNPPHKSHLCHACGCIWRPADVCTTGVRAIATKGQRDTWVHARIRVPGKLRRLTPSQQQSKSYIRTKWWYCDPNAYSIGPFSSAEDMEADIALHYIEDAGTFLPAQPAPDAQLSDSDWEEFDQ